MLKGNLKEKKRWNYLKSWKIVLNLNNQGYKIGIIASQLNY